MTADWRQRHKQELRQQLYETALDLFEVHGYEGTTVLQVTEKVGVAKGTFFNHFPTKEHVVEEWYNDITFRSLEAARKRSTQGAEEAICELFADMVGRATAVPELMIAKSRNNSNPLLMEAEQTQTDEITAFICQQCTDGKLQGELAADLDVPFFAGLLVVVLTGSSRAWVCAQPRFDFPVVIGERVRFLFRSAAVAPGDQAERTGSSTQTS